MLEFVKKVLLPKHHQDQVFQETHLDPPSLSAIDPCIEEALERQAVGALMVTMEEAIAINPSK